MDPADQDRKGVIIKRALPLLFDQQDVTPSFFALAAVKKHIQSRASVV